MEKQNLPCDVVQDLLELYVDQAVKETTSLKITEHIDNCEVCKKIYENIKEGSAFSAKLAAEEKSPAGSFLKLQKKIKNRQKVKLMVAIILSLAVTVGALMFATTNPWIPVSQQNIQVEKAYVLSDYGKNYLFLILSDFPHYTGNLSWTRNVETNSPEKGDLKFYIKRTLFARPSHNPDFKYETDFVELEGDVPNEIYMNGQVIWSKAENGAEEVPEYVGYYVTRAWDSMDLYNDLFTMKLKDGRVLFWDIDGKEVNFKKTED